jgi:hypothetical protein
LSLAARANLAVNESSIKLSTISVKASAIQTAQLSNSVAEMKRQFDMTKALKDQAELKVRSTEWFQGSY